MAKIQKPSDTEEMIVYLYERSKRQDFLLKLYAWAIFILGACMLGSSILN